MLLTRPRAASQEFAAALSARFGSALRPVIAPLMAARFLTPALPAGDFAGVILTSATAAKAARGLGGTLPALAWCVGDKTAQAARAAGFQARSADGDAKALVAAILADPPGGALLHLRGKDSRGDVADRLTRAGVPTVAVVVYDQEPQPLDAQAKALLAAPGPVIVPLFSPRSTTLLAEALPNPCRASLHLAAMSAAVAEAAARLPRAALAVARHPEAGAMLDAVAVLQGGIPPP